MTTPAPTLEYLRHSKDAAWLWDVARARLVWANAAGIEAFGASSVFELVDKLFDASEPALLALAEMQPLLQSDSSEMLRLEFPSLGEAIAFECRCILHTLADGREGVLTIAPAPTPVHPLTETGLLEDLPVATCIITENGALTFANELARRLFDHSSCPNLGALLGIEVADRLMSRLHHARLISDICIYNSLFGQRDTRLTLRRLQANPQAFALLVMEDVTERRQLERQMTEDANRAATLAPQEKHAFEELGRKLNEAMATPPPAAKATAAPIKNLASEPLPAPRAPIIEPVAQPAAKSSQLELRSILDIATDGIITLDALGRILEFSAGAEAIFGYRRAEVSGQPFEDILSPESATILREYIAGLEGQGLASIFNDGREVTGIVKQGGNVPLFLNIGRLHLPQSTAVFCAVIRDITNWKRTEKELREARDVAEAASRHKSDFLARVSHELRTPLNAIMGFSEIMRMGQFGEVHNDKYRGYLNDIYTSAGQLLSMINDLLDLSKIESGRIELNFTSVSLSDCFDHATKQLQEQATRARVVVRKSFPENLPRVVADQRALRQIVTNLLSNAIKYTDAGGQVIASASVSKAGALTFRLKDTGIGMSDTELKKALQPFMRVETPGRNRQGTGLGLPLTKALVEANRAEFAISSGPGQGTLAEVTFPSTRVLAE